MKVSYRGPLAGYKSDAKQEYREQVWSAIAPKIKDMFVLDSRAHVLMLPSKGGEEIEVAINHGIPEDRIIAVDENPALIATAAWRKNRPLVKCYGSSLSRAAQRIKEDGFVLIAANLDLCNNFSEDLVSEVSNFFSNGSRFDHFCFSLTVMKGRENKATSLMLNHIFKGSSRGLKKVDDKRIRALCAVMEDNTSFPLSQLSCIESQGSYLHSKTPMAWCVFSCGFNDKLKSIRSEIHFLTEQSRDLSDSFHIARPSKFYTQEKHWPEKEEKNCIKVCLAAGEKITEYFDCLRAMNTIDDSVEEAERFFLLESGEANDILMAITSRNFARWSKGLSLR
jgi:hypothetical protein